MTAQRTTKQLKLRRGNTAEHANFIGAVGEITVDTDLKTIRVHDGVTLGGNLLMKGNSDTFTLPWSRITNKPIIPTNVSQLNNDAGYITSADFTGLTTDQELQDAVAGLTTTIQNGQAGIIQFLTNSLALKANIDQIPEVPVVPTNVSAFNNDANYVTLNYVSAAIGGALESIPPTNKLVNGNHEFTLSSTGTLELDGEPFTGGASPDFFNLSNANLTLHPTQIQLGNNLIGYEVGDEGSGIYRIDATGSGASTGQWAFNGDTAYNSTGNGLYIQTNQGINDGGAYFPYENEGTTTRLYNNSGAGIELGAGAKSWIFDTDGKLQIPMGGDIVDPDGNSVLGGNFSTGDITFNGVKIIGAPLNGFQFNAISLVPDNTAPFNQSFLDQGQFINIYPTVNNDAPHIHIAAGIGANSTGDLILGDDNYNVDVNHNGYISIKSYDQQRGYSSQWSFGQDGTLYGPAMGGVIVNGLSAPAGSDLYLTGGGNTRNSTTVYFSDADGTEKSVYTVDTNAYYIGNIPPTGNVILWFAPNQIVYINSIVFGSGTATFTLSQPVIMQAGVGYLADWMDTDVHNVIVSANNNNWTFDTNGNLTAPGNVILTGSNKFVNTDDGYLNLRGNNPGPTQRIHLRNYNDDPTSDVNVHLQTGNAGQTFELFQLGANHPSYPYSGGLRSNSTTAPIIIQTDTDNSNNTWVFGLDGTLTIPATGDILRNGVSAFAAAGGLVYSDFSVGTPNSASGTGAISYDNTTGVFKYTPPDLSSYVTSSSLSSTLSSYATQSYVTSQGYITSSALTGYATESYVTGQGYITSSALTGYATQSYVTSQGYTTNTGTVTSVSGTGTVSGLTLSGTVTGTGNLTLGGTLSVALSSLTDIQLVGTPTTGQVLKYDATSGKWYNGSDQTGGSGGGLSYTDFSIGTPNSASGTGAISYDNTTGVFKYTPPDLSSYATTASLSSYATQSYVTSQGYLTTITSTQVTDALGYTPYNSTNPNGYTNNTGTVISISTSGSVNGITLTGGTITSSGTITLGGTLSGINNNQLTNSSITVNGQSISLGGSATITATATNALTIGTGLSGTSYNGSTAVTITNSDPGSAQNIFKTVAVSGQTSVTAASNTATLTLVAGTGITLTTDNTAKSVTITAGGGSPTFTNINTTNITTTGQIVETFQTYSTAITSGSTVTLSSTGGNIWNITSSVAGNWTAALTNVAVTTGQATNVTLILNQGATAYIPNALSINGTAVTINWQGGSPPTGNANKKDAVAFSILQTGASTYLVFGQLVTFG